MNLTPAPAELTPPAAEIATGLVMIRDGLRALIALIFFRNPKLGPSMAIHNYVSHTITRFMALLVRMEAGPLKIRPRAPSTATRERKTPRISFSRKHNWLGEILGWQCRNHTSHLENLLSQPALAARLAATRQASRLLRPLCHMLNITLPWMAPLPRRKRKPRPRSQKKPRAPTRAELRKILWYPNSEGKPMDLLPPRKKRA